MAAFPCPMCSSQTSVADSRGSGPGVASDIPAGDVMRRRHCLAADCGFRFVTRETFFRPTTRPKPATLMAETKRESKRTAEAKREAKKDRQPKRQSFGRHRIPLDDEDRIIERDADIDLHLRGRR